MRTCSRCVPKKELMIGKFTKTEPIYKTREIRFTGTELSNYTPVNKFSLDTIYTNPNVTREGQQTLSDNLQNSMSLEETLNHSFETREKRVQDKETDGAKIFNDFCVDFIDKSAGTKEGITNTIDDVSVRLAELQKLKAHLEEVERQSYRFEMNLPDCPIEILGNSTSRESLE
jgi:hypothetical protein